MTTALRFSPNEKDIKPLDIIKVLFFQIKGFFVHLQDSDFSILHFDLFSVAHLQDSDLSIAHSDLLFAAGGDLLQGCETVVVSVTLV